MELVTARLQLRPPETSDAPRVLELMRDPATVRWNPAAVSDLAAAERWCAEAADWSAGDHASFTIADRGTGRPLGVASLHHIDALSASAQVGFRVHPDARGQGVAAEAVDTLARCGFGFRSLERVQFDHAVENVVSCRVAQRAGFLLEGTLRLAYRYGDHQLHDEHVHARLRTDPEPPAFPSARVRPP